MSPSRILVPILAPAILWLAACQASLPVRGPDGEIDIRIEGNRGVSDEDLREAAERELLTWREKHRAADADDAAFAMRAWLMDEGYKDAQVTFEEVDGGVVFAVEEGERLRYAGARLEGVERIDPEKLRPLFEFEPEGILGFGDVYYSEEDVATAMSRAEDVYLVEGFLDVEVGPHGTERGYCGIRVVVPFVEGRQYTIADVRIEGADRCWLGSDVPIGEPLGPRAGSRLVGGVRRALLEAGYAFAKVTSRTEVDRETATGVITIIVDRGDLVRLRAIHFRGQCRTRRWFMRRRVPLRHGDVVRRDCVERAIADLYASNAFRSVDVSVERVSPDEADLEFEVEEGDSKALDLEVGWGTWELARAKAIYKDYNVFGTGRIFRASALAAVRAQTATLGLEDRWILGRDARVWIQGGASHREEPFYSYFTTGIELGVERRFTRRHRLRGTYTFRTTDPFDVAANLSPQAERELSEFSRTAGLALEYRFDSRDDVYVPSRGTLAEARVFWSTPELGATLEYVELEARAAHHFDLGPVGVLATYAFAGTRSPYGSTDDLPIQHRYFLGGGSSVRAFGQDELTPTDDANDGIGGLTAAMGTLEWRRQIVGILYGATFADAGVVSLDPFSLDGAFGWGYGAGLRLYTPVGPVRFDAAWNPGDRHADDRRFHFFFGFGFSF